MRKLYLRCTRCGRTVDLREGYAPFCLHCRSPLVLEGYDVSREHVLALREEWSYSSYSRLLPLKPLAWLGEGLTPLVKCRVNGVELLFKLEYFNPSGSFKDRGTSVVLSLAVKLGYNLVIEDSSGNTAISVALYCSPLNLTPILVVPSDAPPWKLRVLNYLSPVILEAPSRGDAGKIALEAYLESPNKLFYVAHAWNPIYITSLQTIAYEAYIQSGGYDVAVIPAGSLGLLLSVYKASKTLVELNLLEDMPRIIAVQGVEVCPLYLKLYGRQPPHKHGSRLADGLRVPAPPRLEEGVEAIRQSRGAVIVVDDDEITQALKALKRMGFLVEPTSATALAGFYKALAEGLIDKGERVLIPLTGSGLKTIVS